MRLETPRYSCAIVSPSDLVMSEAIYEYLKNEYVPELLRSRRILDKSDNNQYEIESCKVMPVTTDGTFMLSLCNRVKVDLKPANNNGDKLHFDLVIKLSPREFPGEMFNTVIRELFANEILVYTKVLPQLTHIGYYPRYYFGAVGGQECSVVLGDFSVDGWRMAPTLVNLSLEHILLAVKYLGKFHGNGYAMKELNNDEFQDIVRQLSKTRFERLTTGLEAYDKYVLLAPQRGISAARNSSEFAIEEEHLRRIEKQLDNSPVLCRELVQPVEPLAIICHGDFLRNNIAYKYQDAENPQVPVGVSMFDFQTMCYTSPMMDLVTFMANSTGIDVRGQHFEEIFQAYHSELAAELRGKLGSAGDDLPDKYSYENFLREYLRMVPFGYCVAAGFLAILHDPDATADIDTFPEKLLLRGGAAVDRELAAQLHDWHQLQKKLGAPTN